MASMQQYVTDAWEPIETSRPTRNAAEKTELMLHHYLVFLALAFAVAAPLTWILTGTWAAASVVAGVGLFLASIAAILAPEPDEQAPMK